MHRLLVATEELTKDAPALTKDAQNHLKVLRPKEGERIELFDGKGRSRVYTYSHSQPQPSPSNSFSLNLNLHPQPSSSLSPVSPLNLNLQPQPSSSLSPVSPLNLNLQPQPSSSLSPVSPLNLNLQPQPLTLFACVTKGSRWDWTIEKATELGVTEIVPVISGRTIVRIDAKDRAAKRARWTRIAEDAARQSDAKWIPTIHEPVTFAESLALVKKTTCFVGALTTPPPQPIAAALNLNLQPQPSLFVGPEGDFTPEELAALIAIATPVSFGTTILRAETAAIYGLSVLKSYLDLNLPPQPSSPLNLNLPPQPCTP